MKNQAIMRILSIIILCLYCLNAHALTVNEKIQDALGYMMEKDIKNLTHQFEELLFKLDDMSNVINSLDGGAISTAPNEDVSLKLKELEARLIMLE